MKKTTSNNLLLALLALAQFMVVLDASVVNIALPSIQRTLHFSVGNLQWVVTAYTLAFGGFLLLGGRAADLYGRRRVFLTGLVGFTIGSMAAGLSDSSTLLIMARGAQGLFAAFMSPAALSIVLATFSEGKERNRALGVWGAVAAGGAAAGVLLGGILTQYLNWRWNFFINVPVGIFVGFSALRLVPAHASEADHNDLDLPGALLVTSGLMTLVYALTKAPTWGWGSHSTLAWLGSSAILLAGFVLNEARSAHPLIPLGVFRIRNLTGANLTQLPITASLFSMFFFVSLYVQTILGYDPVRSGLSFLPVTFIIAITATVASRLVARIGYKPFLVIAPLFMAFGLYLLSHISVGGSYVRDVLPGLAVIAFGAGASFVSVSIAATSGIRKEQSGLASGLLNTAQQIGGSLGLAILSGIAASKSAASLTAHIAANPAALAATGGKPSPSMIAAASVAGFRGAIHVGIWFAVGASVVALVLIKQRRGEPKTSEAIGEDLESVAPALATRIKL
jgi:EmrB/QacA subfamily drug resistance transporter